MSKIWRDVGHGRYLFRNSYGRLYIFADELVIRISHDMIQHLISGVTCGNI
jgi:hypothetical protein